MSTYPVDVKITRVTSTSANQVILQALQEF